MKYIAPFLPVKPLGRSPCGERGLKFDAYGFRMAGVKSLPVRGAWIEIISESIGLASDLVAPRAGSVD